LERADDIGLDKFPRPIDGSIYMRFSGKMHDAVRLKIMKRLLNVLGGTNIGFRKGKSFMVPDTFERLEIAGVSQLVDNVDRMISVLDQMSHKVAADESRAASD
jgi:hypothetical protein